MNWNKKKILNSIFWSAISFLGLWLLISALTIIFDLEFNGELMLALYWLCSLVLAPIAVLLTLTKTVKGKFRFLLPVQIVLVLFASVIPVLVFIFYNLLNECTWRDKEVLFEHKSHYGEKIISRRYNCWTTAEDIGPYSNHKVESLALIFRTFEFVDTAHLDENQWIRIKPERQNEESNL